MGDFCAFEALKRQDEHNKKSPAIAGLSALQDGLEPTTP